MIGGAAILILTPALFSATLPEAARIKRLAPLFLPQPGQAFKLIERDVREAKKNANALALRGQIMVTPPKGHCLVITVNEERDDEIVCKPRLLVFTLADTDRMGRLNFTVKTGDGDFGTPLSWQSPYRMAIVEPYTNAKEDPPRYRFIESCRGVRSDFHGRKLEITLLGGEQWVVHIPEHETLMPQPDPPPNLYLYSAAGKVSVAEAAKSKKDHEEVTENKEDEGKHEEKSEGEHGAKHEENHEEAKAEGHGGGHSAGQGSSAAKPQPSADPDAPPDPAALSHRNVNPNDQKADRLAWAVGARNSYWMNASFFQPNGSVPSGMVGRCRYNYDVGKDDPGVGRLECYEADIYRHVYLPVTCFKDIK